MNMDCYFYIFLILNDSCIHEKITKISQTDGWIEPIYQCRCWLCQRNTRKRPIMKRTSERERERVHTRKTVCVADRRGKNGSKNDKWQTGKWEGTCPRPSSQSLAFSSHGQSNVFALHLAIPQFSLTSRSSATSRSFSSVVSSRVRAPRVISRPPLHCLTTHREKLIRERMARWAFRSWAFDVIFPLRFLIVRSLPNGSLLQEAIVWSRRSWVKTKDTSASPLHELVNEIGMW